MVLWLHPLNLQHFSSKFIYLAVPFLFIVFDNSLLTPLFDNLLLTPLYVFVPKAGFKLWHFELKSNIKTFMGIINQMTKLVIQDFVFILHCSLIKYCSIMKPVWFQGIFNQEFCYLFKITLIQTFKHANFVNFCNKLLNDLAVRAYGGLQNQLYLIFIRIFH